MQVYDVGIVGGGASGLSSAVCAGRMGARVLVLERMDRVGRKILATGNGRCNLANRRIADGDRAIRQVYRCSQDGFAGQVMGAFGLEEVLGFFSSIGIQTTSRDGYLYPASLQAASVRDALERAVLETGNADIRTQVCVKSILAPGKRRDWFEVRDSQGKSYACRRLILAAGGRSSSKLGSDGSGYRLCQELGHRLIPCVPALCALTCREDHFKRLAGIRTRGRISILAGGTCLAADEGELQLTAAGLSGIPAFQVSRFASYALASGDPVTARVDFFPDRRKSWLISYLQQESQAHPTFTMEMILQGLVNKKLAETLCLLAGCRNKAGSDWTGEALQDLAGLAKGLRCQVTGTAGFDSSQVTAGGMDTRQIDPRDLSSRLVPGLYVTGELLDVDGICGGYNLCWAWATGCLAGRSAARSATGGKGK